MKRNVLLLALTLWGNSLASAQVLKEIQFEGFIIAPDKSTEVLSIVNERPKTSSITFDAKNLRYFFKLDSTLLEIDIPSQTFSKHRIPTDKETGRMHYDTVSNRLLLWDYGVGRVFWWNPENAQLKQIDNSFSHKNQFNHAQWVIPQTLDIYAFGGYGLFKNKTFTSVYQQSHREWFLVHERFNSIKPLKPFSVNAIEDDYLFVQSSNIVVHKNEAIDTLTNARLINWLLHSKTFEWTPVSIIDLDNLNNYDYEKLTLIEHNNLRLQSSGQTTIVSHQTQTGNHSIAISLIYDEYTGFKILLTETRTGKTAIANISPLTPFPIDVIHPVYHAKENRLYALGFSQLSTTGTNPIVVYKSNLLDIPALFEYVERNSISEPFSEFEITNSYFTPVFFSASFLVIGLVLGFVLYHKNPDRTPSDTNSTKEFDLSAKGFVIRALQSGTCELSLNHNVVKEPFSKAEMAVLHLFVQAKISGRDFIVTDELNALFEYGNSSFDYARKQRNLTVKSLEDRLQKIKPSKKAYIIQKRNHEDSRKRDYSLNWELFTLDEV